MCPSSCIPLTSENEYQKDDVIFMSLFNFKSGEPLPLNVTSDVNPFQYRPLDLPVDLWYLCSGVKKEADYGFWQETEAACEIFSNSVITGLKTTFRFHEGRAPHGQKTDWVMHEYRITSKIDNDTMDLRALCRVFLSNENRPPSGHCCADVDVKISINLGPIIVLTSELVEKTDENKTGPSLVTKRSPDHFLENSSELDCIMMGDYLELNDLVDPGSRSSGSSNLSCLTMTSDDYFDNEYFDSMALLQDLQDDIIDQEMKDSRVKFDLSAPVKSKEEVLHTTTLASIGNNKARKPSAEETDKLENRIRSTSNVVDITSSSSSYENTFKEDVSWAKRRKLMKYICLLAF